ncbi:hypothetical protein LEP1GSC127_0703 [Leptospira kirschneri str. 200801925]|nr:hypothetical protein LEP1GSC127_0703 [Leptospira kirschneri str. 200801925]
MIRLILYLLSIFLYTNLLFSEGEKIRKFPLIKKLEIRIYLPTEQF